MKSFLAFKKIIEEELLKLDYPKEPDLLYKPVNYIMGLQSKRMRSILVLMAYELFRKDFEKAIPVALAIEIFHNFTLLHDDIMDNAPLRRGHPTVHQKWNQNIAILSGDTMLIKSYQLLNNVEKNIVKDILNVFSKAAINVCEGQQLDMDFENMQSVSIDEYLKMIEYKTAILLAASLKLGGIAAGASKKDQNNLYEFGRNIGIAFQLKDDLLDVFGSFKSFGKQVGGDIIANKKTYLYLKALEIANSNQYNDLINYYSLDQGTKNKVLKVTEIFNDLNINQLTKELMLKFQKKALQNLDAISSNNKKSLIDFSELLLNRES